MIAPIKGSDPEHGQTIEVSGWERDGDMKGPVVVHSRRQHGQRVGLCVTDGDGDVTQCWMTTDEARAVIIALQRAIVRATS